MKQYLQLMNDILSTGCMHPDRTGTGRMSLYAKTLVFDMNDGFPLVTTRHISNFFIHELLWHISGSCDVTALHENKVHIWDNWAVTKDHIKEFMDKFLHSATDAEKDALQVYLESNYLNSVGPIYGPNLRASNVMYPFNRLEVKTHKPLVKKSIMTELQNTYDDLDPMVRDQYKDFNDFVEQEHVYFKDQLLELIDGLQKRPYSSRHVINFYVHPFIPNENLSPQENVLFGKGALMPCPTLLQFYVTTCNNVKELSVILYQRSCDVPIGAPANIAQYSLLLHMIAQICRMHPRYLHYTIGDAHIYENQRDLVKEQLLRTPLSLPSLTLHSGIDDIDEFTMSDIKISNYKYYPKIQYPISV